MFRGAYSESFSYKTIIQSGKKLVYDGGALPDARQSWTAVSFGFCVTEEASFCATPEKALGAAAWLKLAEAGGAAVFAEAGSAAAFADAGKLPASEEAERRACT